MQKYYKGIAGIDSKRFIACLFLDDDPTNPDPLNHVEITLLTDGSVLHFDHVAEFEKFTDYQQMIPESEYRMLGMMAKLSNELFMHGYKKGYPHSPVCNTIAKLLTEEFSKYRRW